MPGVRSKKHAMPHTTTGRVLARGGWGHVKGPLRNFRGTRCGREAPSSHAERDSSPRPPTPSSPAQRNVRCPARHATRPSAHAPARCDSFAIDHGLARRPRILRPFTFGGPRVGFLCSGRPHTASAHAATRDSRTCRWVHLRETIFMNAFIPPSRRTMGTPD